MASLFTKQESREVRLSPDFLDEWSTLYKPLYRHNNKSGVSISPAAGGQRQQLLRIARPDFFQKRADVPQEKLLDNSAEQAYRLLQENPDIAKLIIATLQKIMYNKLRKLKRA